jgi:phosphoribosylformylglycinamidine synthase
MYVDGNLEGNFGERHKVSGLETMQFTGTSVIGDIRRCVTMDAKIAGDLLYVLGLTRNELGGSEYYDALGYTGLNVPRVDMAEVIPLYQGLSAAVAAEKVASVHGVYRGGLGVHFALVAMAGGLGLEVDLGQVLAEGVERDDTLLYSESAGRFIVTIAPEDREAFNEYVKGLSCACVGRVVKAERLTIRGRGGESLLSVGLRRLRSAWKRPFGDLI